VPTSFTDFRLLIFGFCAYVLQFLHERFTETLGFYFIHHLSTTWTRCAFYAFCLTQILSTIRHEFVLPCLARLPRRALLNRIPFRVFNRGSFAKWSCGGTWNKFYRDTAVTNCHAKSKRHLIEAYFTGAKQSKYENRRIGDGEKRWIRDQTDQRNQRNQNSYRNHSSQRNYRNQINEIDLPREILRSRNPLGYFTGAR